MSQPTPDVDHEAADVRQRLAALPTYARSLLKIAVPVTVTLATTRQPLARILDLAPGTIIQFNKSCDEPLTLQIGNHTVAEGEAVKVGEKFGLRINSLTLPGERFISVARASGQPNKQNSR